LDNLKGKRILIIVDDAQKLAIKQDIITILQQESKERHGKYIWVETEFFEEEQKGKESESYTRVDFQSFLQDLLKNFYESQNPTLQKALEGRIEGLSDAIARVKEGKIRDAWHFAFVASRGEERLAQETDHLSDLEMLVLFFISAYTVLSWESELPSNYYADKLENIRFGWLTDALRKSSFSDAIRSLQKQTKDRKSMIRIYDKSKSDRGYIASLHYNFARAVIRASLLRTRLVKDLLSSVRELLTSEYRRCAYIDIFLREIGSYAGAFVKEIKDWLIGFLSNPLPDKLLCYVFLLRSIKNVSKDIYEEIIGRLDVDRIAEKVREAEPRQFDPLANLLKTLGSRRDPLIEKLDLVQLSKKAADTEAQQFAQLAYLLKTLGDLRYELIEELDFVQLSKKASDAEARQFAQLGDLAKSLGDREAELIEKLDLMKLLEKAGAAEVDQIAHLLNALGDRRDELIEKLDLAQLSEKAGAAEIVPLALLLNALGDRRDELIEKLDFVQLSEKAGAAEIDPLALLLNALGDRRDELIEKLDFVQLSEKAGAAEIDPLAHLLNALGDRRDELIEKLDFVQLSEKAGAAEMAPLAHLFNALGDRRDELIEKLDFVQLSEKAGAAEIDPLAHLLNALGHHRHELLQKLDLEELSKKVNGIEVGQFQQIAQLLSSFGDLRDELIEKLDYKAFAQRANQVDPTNTGELIGLTLFIAQLDEERRDKFVPQVHWVSICKQCPINATSFAALGASLENLLKQADILSDSSGVDDVAVHLRAHVSEIKQCIRKIDFAQYRGLAKFLWNWNHVNHQLTIEISDANTLEGLVAGFRVYPSNYRGVGELINALYSIDPPLSKSFIKNKKVKGVIEQSINRRDWGEEEEEDLKHLIKALYKSTPELWKKMVSYKWITVDLSSLDLDSIYRDVDEEKKVIATDNSG